MLTPPQRPPFRFLRCPCLWLSVVLMTLLGSALPAAAHPMGNFSINHYARFEAHAAELHLRYILDFAEIPTVTERDAMHADETGKALPANRAEYLSTKSAELLHGLSLTVNGSPAPLKIQATNLVFQPGSGGLPILRVILDGVVSLPLTAPPAGWQIVYRDTNYAERTGWKEIVAQAGRDASLRTSSVPMLDQSQELTRYPTDLSIVPPRVTEATFTVGKPGEGGGVPAAMGSGQAGKREPGASGGSTPRDAFTQAITTQKLTAGIVLVSLGLSFLFGAFHALSPGHGKTMVAAYLVGTRGTAKHALFLGLVVTLTHTIGVFMLGFVTLFAARYIVPERLYPILSALSGLGIIVIGLGMLWTRLASARRIHAASEDLYAEDDERESFFASEEAPSAPTEGNDSEPLSFKTLLVLGITGGALPCPSALVVMLSAIALHRVAFGMAMIVAFSLGLATILTAIGILVIRARGFLERLPLTGRLTTRLPVLSAILVTLIGVVLLVRSFSGSF